MFLEMALALVTASVATPVRSDLLALTTTVVPRTTG